MNLPVPPAPKDAISPFRESSRSGASLEYFVLKQEDGTIYAPVVKGQRGRARPRLFFSRGASERYCDAHNVKARPMKVLVRVFTCTGEEL